MSWTGKALLSATLVAFVIDCIAAGYTGFSPKSLLSVSLFFGLLVFIWALVTAERSP